MLKRNRLIFVVKAAVTLGVFGVFLFSVNLVLAQVSGDLGLSQVEPTLAIATQTDIRVIIARIIQVALGLVGIILVALIVYGGFLYMTSAGDSTKAAKARKVITEAIIGLLIILSSLAITEFIIRSITGALFGGGGGGGERQFVDPLSGAYGSGIIQDHYPARDATEIPRNAKIIITFKEAIKPESLIEDSDRDGVYGNSNDKLNSDNIKIRRSADDAASGPFVLAFAAKSADNRTFVFKPDGLLGSSVDNIKYAVALAGGAAGVKKANGEAAFGANFSRGYQWEFTTGTFVDETPPQWQTVMPAPRVLPYDKNISIEITFNEPIDPLTGSGDSPGFNNLKVSTASAAVEGAFVVSNGYRTVGFIAKQACGKNACGETIFCLPGGAAITTLIKAASLSASPPAAMLPYPYDGITDIAGNSLDGNKNGVADVPPADNFLWDFSTSNNIDLTAPTVLKIAPDSEQPNYDAKGEVSLEFSKVMLSGSLNNSNLLLHGARSGETSYNLTLAPWWTVRNSYLDIAGAATTESGAAVRSLVTVPHGDFLKDTSYYPEATAGLKDSYQNCYFPSSSSDTTASCAATLARPYCCAATACGNPCGITSSGAPVCPNP